MKNIYIVFALLAGATLNVKAQIEPPAYRQFHFNPYLFNPAFAGSNDQAEVNMFYEKQWIGIKDAPSSLGLSLQLPAGERTSLGINIVSDKQVILKRTAITGTFGYMVPFGKDHALRFALSGGVGMNRFDFTTEELNSNDPVIMDAAGNTSAVQGNFGVVYQLAKLKLGFALTELFETDPFDEESHNTFSMRSLKNRLFSASYRFNLDRFENFQMEPYLLYNQSINPDRNYLEGSAVVYYRGKIWSGAGYNTRHGIAMHFGAELLNGIKFSYSYEFPPIGAGSRVSNSHELQLRVAFGKRIEPSGFNPRRH